MKKKITERNRLFAQKLNDDLATEDRSKSWLAGFFPVTGDPNKADESRKRKVRRLCDPQTARFTNKVCSILYEAFQRDWDKPDDLLHILKTREAEITAVSGSDMEPLAKNLEALQSRIDAVETGSQELAVAQSDQNLTVNETVGRLAEEAGAQAAAINSIQAQVQGLIKSATEQSNKLDALRTATEQHDNALKRVDAVETAVQTIGNELSLLNIELNEKIESVTSCVDSSAARIDELEGMIRQASDLYAEKADQLDGLSIEVGKLDKTLHTKVDEVEAKAALSDSHLQLRIDSCEHSLANLSHKVDELQSNVTALKQQNKEQREVIYEQGEQIQALKFEHSHRGVLDSTVRFWWVHGGWVPSRQKRSALLSFMNRKDMDAADFRDLVSNQYLSVNEKGDVSILNSSIWRRLSIKVYLCMAMFVAVAFAFFTLAMGASLNEAIIAFLISTVYVCISQYKIDTASDAQRLAERWRMKLSSASVA